MSDSEEKKPSPKLEVDPDDVQNHGRQTDWSQLFGMEQNNSNIRKKRTYGWSPH